MKLYPLVLLLLLLQFVPSRVLAAFYRWLDADGVVHFTDDPKRIPLKYRQKAKKLDLPAESAPAPTEPSPQASPQAYEPSLPGGHAEDWWRQRFATLRDEVKALQDGLVVKQEKLVELRRTRTIYQRARDREAVNRMEADISGDETRLSRLLNQMEALDREATRAAVPAQWRR